MYLKLDKKLILEVEEIVFEIKKTSVESSHEDIKRDIDFLPKVLKIFEKIDIERLKIKDNEFTILINEEKLYLDNKFINISANLDFKNSQIELDLYSLYLKDIDLALIGKTKVDVKKEILNFFGTFMHKDVEGELNIQATPKILDFYINTTKDIKSIKFLKNFFRLNKIAEAWMYDNVTGDMKLNFLTGKIDLEKEKALINTIKGNVEITNAKIKFHKDAKTVDTKMLRIDYKGDTLSFDLENPVYNKSKIYGSKIDITNLTSLEKGKVVLSLKSESLLNNDILEILKAFKINLPLSQKSGELDSSLVLKIPYLLSKKMEVDGVFKLKNAVLKLNDFEFLAKKADVILKDSLVTIKNSNIIHKDMLNADLELQINTKNSTALGNAKINSFDITNEKDSIISIRDLETNLDIDFKDNTKIILESLSSQLNISKENILIDIMDLSKVYNYSSLLKTSDIKKGDLHLNVKNKDDINFSINAKELNLPFERKGEKITTLSAKGVIKNNLVTINTNDNDISIIIKKDKNTLLKLKNVDLILGKSNNKNSKSFPNIDLQLTNSMIKLDENHYYKTSFAEIHIKNQKISFEGKALYLDLPISKNGKRIRDLELLGTYEKNILDIKTKDGKLELKYDVPNEKISMDLNGYDVLYDSKQEENKEESKTAYYINGINSNIIMNDKYVAKASSYKFIFENYKTDIDLKYKNTEFVYHKDFDGLITVNAKNMNDEFLDALMNKNLIEGGNVNLNASGKNGIINGVATLKGNKIVDLAILNNLLIFINTSPGLINPLLAIPSVVGMATSGGFNLNGYKVKEGKVKFSYDFNNKFLNMHTIETIGNGIDFKGNTTINFNNSKLDAKLKLIFLKDYSKIVGAIPVLNYVLLGDEKRVDTEVTIYGTLDEPKYKTNLIKDGVSAPVNFLKRVITSPIKMIESIGNSLEKDDKPQNEEKKK